MKVAVLGYGTVGSGVVDVINKNNECVSAKAGEEVEVKYILDLRDFPGDYMEKFVVHDYDVIVNDPEVKVICETMGGVEPAYTFSKRALMAGKSVCTSNKELVALHGPELIAIAKENNCNYLFEASVGGGIPIIRPLNACLTAEKMEGITGILNGTTNYMLTKMDEDGSDYDDVLKQAQDLGYAEKNPSADVEGYDACRKISILSSLAIGKTVNFEDVHTEGITAIDSVDFKYAAAIKKSIKLLGISRMCDDDKPVVMVAPFMVAMNHPMYNVKDVFNAIMVTGNMVGDTMYYGRGAGKLPTASAVVGDVIDAIKNQGRFIDVTWKDEVVSLADYQDVKFEFLVRMDAAADKQKCKELFDTEEIITLDGVNEFGFRTGMLTQKELENKLSTIGNPVKTIRIF